MKTPTKLMLLATIFSGAFLLNSCSKNDDMSLNSASALTATSSNQLMEKAIFDKELKITNAIDDGMDITAQFQDITFLFNGPSSNGSGVANAYNDLLNVHGTWTMPNGSEKITFAYPTNILTQLAYLNKEWIIADGNGSSMILTAANGENDRVTFAVKNK